MSEQCYEVIPIDPTKQRAEWLDFRRDHITATDAVDIILGKYRTPLEVYREKTSPAATPDEPTLIQRIGNHMERFLAVEYERITGVPVGPTQILVRSIPYPWLTATIDTFDSNGDILEFKTTNHGETIREIGDGDSELPPEWLIQTHVQMLVTGRNVVKVCVLVGFRDFRILTVTRDEELCRVIIGKLGAFRDNINHRVEPDAAPSDAKLLSIMRAEDGEGATIEGCDRLRLLADDYRHSKETIRLFERRAETAKAEILSRLKGVSGVVFSDGSTLRLRTVKGQDAKTIQRKASPSYVVIDVKLAEQPEFDQPRQPIVADASDFTLIDELVA